MIPSTERGDDRARYYMRREGYVLLRNPGFQTLVWLDDGAVSELPIEPDFIPSPDGRVRDSKIASEVPLFGFATLESRSGAVVWVGDFEIA